jgi:hypothetical protein
MIIENMTSQMLYVVSLSLTSTEKWKAAGSFTSGSTSRRIVHCIGDDCSNYSDRTFVLDVFKVQMC